MKLEHLFAPDSLPGAWGKRDVHGLALDSRKVREGYLFAALKGEIQDGRNFIPEAIEHGARIILLQKEDTSVHAEGLSPDIVEKNDDRFLWVYEPYPGQRLAQLAARFYPRQPENLVAVTGTNGKSSTAEFLRQIWGQAGFKAASLGTLGLSGVDVDPRENFSLTTPDCITLHSVLQFLKDRGFDHVIMEASSHGLKQNRLDGARLKAAAFTNLSQDHFDYHNSFEDYFSAKKRLFEELLPKNAPCLIHVDDRYGTQLAQDLKDAGRPVITLGWGGDDLKLLEVTTQPDRQFVRYAWRGREGRVNLPLVGEFQVFNAFMAASLALALGSEEESVFSALECLRGASGRLEKAGETEQGCPVFVDYAHTPDGLEKLLRALRPHTHKHLHLVFGCGGNRDPKKRPHMGAVAARLADKVFITDDNPRHEDPALIRKAILEACPGGREVADRALAIRTGLNALEKGDCLVIAGKGHEAYQILGDRSLPFSDLQIVRKILQEKKRGQNEQKGQEHA